MDRNPYQAPTDVSGELPKAPEPPLQWLNQPFHPWTLLTVLITLAGLGALIVLWNVLVQ